MDSAGAVTAHLDHMRMRCLSGNAIYQRRNALKRLAAALPVPLLDATADDLAAWRAGLTAGPRAVGPRTVANYLMNISEFYAYTTRHGLTAANPAAGIPRPRLGRLLPRPIAEADLMAALDCAPERVRLWLVLAAWCGMRACEVAGLRVQSIILDARPPVLLIAAEATKGRTERLIPLCDFAVSEIRAANLPRSGYAFPRRDGQRGPNTPGVISKLAGEHLHDCGIDATFHSLRHFFGTETYRACHDLLVVMDLMGHQSPLTTAGYAAYDRQSAVAAVQALPAPKRRLRAVPSKENVS